MKTRDAILISAFLGLSGATISPAVAAPQLPAAPTYYVLDESRTLSKPELTALEDAVVEHDRLTGEQIMIAVLAHSPEAGLDEYARELSREWSVGRSSQQGALLIVDWPKRMARLEVGIGMGSLPLDRAQEIEKEDIAPLLARSELAPALGSGILQILRTIDSPLVTSGRARQLLQPLIASNSAAPRGGLGWIWVPLLLIGLLLTLTALVNVMAAEVHYTSTGWLQISPLKLALKSRKAGNTGPPEGKIGGAFGHW